MLTRSGKTFIRPWNRSARRRGLVGLASVVLGSALLLVQSLSGQERPEVSSQERLARIEDAQTKMAAQLQAIQKELELLEAELRSLGSAPRAAPVAPIPTDLMPIAGAPTKGLPTARTAIVEYSDFQCPFCGEFVRTVLPLLDKEYLSTGKAVLVFRHLPLEELHPRAMAAAESAECALQQGQFWPMHDLLFAHQKDLGDAALSAMARDVSLDMTKYEKCRAATAGIRVRQDRASAEKLGVGGTPTFFIGVVESGKMVRVINRLDGTKSIAAFRAVLDPALAQLAKEPLRDRPPSPDPCQEP